VRYKTKKMRKEREEKRREEKRREEKRREEKKIKCIPHLVIYQHLQVS